MTRRLLALFICALASLNLVKDAAASIDLRFLGVDPGNGSGAVNLVYGSSPTTVRANIGQMVWAASNDIGSPAISPSGDDIITFCIELSQYVSGATQIYQKAPLADAPNPGIAGYTGYKIGSSRAMALDLLADNFWAAATGSSLLDAVAFQLAVWEIVHEMPTGALDNPPLAATLDVSQSAGSFYVDASPSSGLLFDAINQANSWLTLLSTSQLVANDSLSVIALTNPTKQDQIIQFASPPPPPTDPQGGLPEPVSLLVWGGLFGICLGMTHRNKR